MPDVKIENLEKNLVKLTFTLTSQELLPYLTDAATHLSEHSEIPGFRPGKANYDIVKQRFGEMKILEEALESIVRSSYVQALLAHDIETVGSPKIDVSKLAPDNDLVFTAEVTRMPKASELAMYKDLRVEPKTIVVEDKEIDLALRDLQRMQTKEVRAPKETPIGATDKVVVSMIIKKNGVAIEGGSSPNHMIYLNEDYYIPGLKERLIGLKEDEQKAFSLSFPKDHVQKMLAGSQAEFEITIKEVYHLQPPELDDAFAVTHGLKDLQALKAIINKNLLEEKQQEEAKRQEREVLELIAKKSRFEEIPDLLLNEEINKMIEELKRGVESQGLEFETYIANLKRTLAQLKMDFTPQALTRIKVALVLRAIADQEHTTVEEKEIDTELDRVAEHYQDKEAKEQIYAPEYREYVQQILRNRKVIEFLKSVMVK
ncbi:trigger factor [Candidatus Uhrbacteria bacterium]|nr:trigger factor [Candidatus Uhrbacteria bacterium]